MKKRHYVAAVFLCAAAAYLAGYWSGSPVGPGAGTAVTEPPQPAGKTGSAVSEDTFPSGTVRVSPEKQQVMGIRLAPVERSAEAHTLRVLGRVAADETRIYQINAAVDGWIRQTYNNPTGTLVKKDERLATFYSPEFLSAQQAYIVSLGAIARQKAEGERVSAQTTLSRVSNQQYAEALQNLGMSEKQIEEIARTGQRTQDVQILAPAPGFILARNITPNQRFSKGTELFRIADLRRVWVVMDLFENEARHLKPGTVAKVIVPQMEKTFTAKISATPPQFDSATRTLKMRLEADNPAFVLRPDMFVDVELPVTFPPAVTVPADAVLDSGLKQTVFVDRGSGFFEPRQVETGWRFGNRGEITRGLEPGERIVVSGNFLIDSESRMELAAAGMYGTIEKDPVCGAAVTVKKALKEGRTSIHQDRTYYFSSSDCKERFDRDPARYAVKPVEGND